MGALSKLPTLQTLRALDLTTGRRREADGIHGQAPGDGDFSRGECNIETVSSCFIDFDQFILCVIYLSSTFLVTSCNIV